MTTENNNSQSQDEQAEFNQEQYDILKRCSENKEITEWNSYRVEHPKVRIHLKNADLEGADLRGADLRGADLRGADLKGAKLRGAYLRDAIYEKITDYKLLKSTERVNVVINLADDITYEEVTELLRALNGLYSSLVGFTPHLNEIQIGQHTEEYAAWEWGQK